MRPLPQTVSKKLMTVCEDLYNKAIYWILREHGSSKPASWPPRNVCAVAGWKVTLLISFIFDRAPREVAIDIIERYEHHGEPR